MIEKEKERRMKKLGGASAF